MRKLLLLLSTVLLLSSCTFSKISELPSSELNPVFFYESSSAQKAVYETGSPYTKLFDADMRFMTGSVSPLSTGVLAFQSIKSMSGWYGVLYYITRKGTVISRTYLNDTAMEIKNDFALSQSDIFSRGGFAYTLYKVKNDSLGSFALNPLEKIWTGNLDCFRSAVLFTGDVHGTVYLAGGTEDNSVNNLYRYTKEDGDFVKIFTVPHASKLINPSEGEKASDFMNMIPLSDESIIIFPSQNFRYAADFDVFLLRKGEVNPVELSVTGLGEKVLCLTGRGFEVNGKIGITAALSADMKGRIAMAVFVLNGNELVCEKLIEDTYAAALVYGKDPATGSLWYYGDSGTCSKDVNALCSFDGSAVIEQALP